MSVEIISADDHVHEPPDLWTSRAPRALRDEVPHVVHEPDADWWICEGKKIVSFGPGTQTGQRFKDASVLTFSGRADDVRPGAYLPRYRLEDMTADGIAMAVLYPSVGLAVHNFASAAMMEVIAHAYNDWLAEFCAADAKRLKGMCILNVEDIGGAVRELERCAKLGFVGAMIPVYPGEDKRYRSAAYEPLWTKAEELQMPLGLHLGAYRPGPGNEMSSGVATSTAFRINYDYWVRMAIVDMIFTGVFERHPKLQFGAVEHELAWIPHLVQQMDYMYTQRIRSPDAVRFRDDALPSDFWRRNCFACFQQDAAGIQLRNVIGVDNMLWGSDYPHVESTFPRSRELLAGLLSECSADEQARIKRENVRRVFRLD